MFLGDTQCFWKVRIPWPTPPPSPHPQRCDISMLSSSKGAHEEGSVISDGDEPRCVVVVTPLPQAEETMAMTESAPSPRRPISVPRRTVGSTLYARPGRPGGMWA